MQLLTGHPQAAEPRPRPPAPPAAPPREASPPPTCRGAAPSRLCQGHQRRASGTSLSRTVAGAAAPLAALVGPQDQRRLCHPLSGSPSCFLTASVALLLDEKAPNRATGARAALGPRAQESARQASPPLTPGPGNPPPASPQPVHTHPAPQRSPGLVVPGAPPPEKPAHMPLPAATPGPGCPTGPEDRVPDGETASERGRVSDLRTQRKRKPVCDSS